MKGSSPLVHHALTRALALAFPAAALVMPVQAHAQNAPAVLPAVDVQATSSAQSDPSAPGYTATRSRSATKSNTSLLETPQTVNVVTAEEMARQGSTSVTQALRFTPGVITQYGDSDVRHDWLTVRGFTPPRYLDGLVLPFGIRGYAQPRIETYGLERIEVLKGPSSGLYGQTGPGGLIDMRSKRPTADTLREVEVQVGNQDRKQLGLDFGGKIGDSEVLTYRLTGVARASGTQYDMVDDDKGFLQGALGWAISDRTQLTLQAQYQKIRSDGGGGAPALPYIGTAVASPLGYIARDRYVGDPRYDRFTDEQTLVGYTLEHQFNDALSFRQTARYSHVDTDSRRVQVGQLAPDNTRAVRYAWAFPETASTVQIDNQLSADLGWGATRHRLTVGLDALRERSDFTESQLNILTAPGSSAFDLFDLYRPNYGSASLAVPPDGTVISQRREQLGIYLQDQISIDRFRITLSGRQDWTNTDTSTRAGTRSTRTDIDANRFTGRAAVAYVFDNGVSPYLSYSTSFQPVSGTTREGASLKPTTGKQLELGAKYQPANSQTMVSASVFQLKQDNVSAPDPLNTSFSVQTGQVEATGLEVEAKTQLTPELALTASYALTDTEITRTNAGDTTGRVGNRMAFVPRHQAALWADYTVREGALAGLGLGAGVRYRGTFFGDLDNRYGLRGVTLVDAAVRYDLGRANAALKGANVSLAVSNLFDRKYVSNCLGPVSCYWGTERTVTATVRYRW